MKIQQMFGFRVLVQPVPEKTGSIILPQNARNEYMVGRVVAVGNGVQPRGEVEPTLVEIGDLVWFQTNDHILASQSYTEGRQTYLNLHQGDLLARLDSPALYYSGMEPLGRWLFVETFQKDTSAIVLPENTADQFVYYKASKIGSRLNLPVAVGQEVLLNQTRVGFFRMRVSALTDTYATYGYIDRDYVLATLADEPGAK